MYIPCVLILFSVYSVYTRMQLCIHRELLGSDQMNISVAKSELRGPPRVDIVSMVYEAFALTAVSVFLIILVI